MAAGCTKYSRRELLLAVTVFAVGCSDHLDVIEQYDPSLARNAATCQVSIDDPSANWVFAESDDADPTLDGIQIAATLSYAGSNCKELHWGLCGMPLEASESVHGMSGGELSVSFTLVPGRVKLCAEAVDARQRPSSARPVAVEQKVCLAPHQQCTSDPICHDLSSDPSHCGKCGNRCPLQLHATATCVRGVCGLACEDGYHLDPGKSGGDRVCMPRPGCAGLTEACSGDDCCAWDVVAEQDGSAVRFQRGYDASNVRGDLADEWQPRDDMARVSVQQFFLDRYEVSVGRFRRFLAAYDDWIAGGVQPRAGHGEHPALAGSGWQNAWTNLSLRDAMLMADAPVVPPSASDFRTRVLKCGSFASFSEEEGDREDLPINCVSFFEAFLFCMWDKGRLPTEAEWNAAAASSAQRYFPWSIAPESTLITPQHALYGRGEQLPDPVGSHPAGAGPFHSHDLAGNVYEWTRDSEIVDPACKHASGSCSYGGDKSDPIELTGDADPFGQQYHVLRGGSYKAPPSRLRTAHRYVMYGMTRISDIGVRCARPMVTD